MAESLTEKLTRRKQITEQIAGLNAELEGLDRDIFARVGKVVEAFEGTTIEDKFKRQSVDVSAPAKFPSPEQRSPIETANKSASRQEIEAATTEVLRAAGKPLKLRFLLDELIKRGIRIGGQKPAGNLSAHLSLSNHFETASDGWWFKGQARPINKNAPEGANLI